MLIHTPVRQLHVLRILQKTADAVSYVCTDVLENVPQYYLLNGFLQQETYSYLIPMIIEQQKEYFTDFIEYFSSDGIFYLMFRYYDGIPCMEAAEHANMETRLEYVRQMLEQMILQAMPAVFQYALLDPEHIKVTESHQVKFLYQFSGTFAEREIDFHEIELRLLQLIQMLLIPELAMRYSLKLLEFCKDLEHGNEFRDYQSLYIAYTEIQRELVAQKGNLVSHKYQFQLWEKVKQKFYIFRNILVTAVIVAAVGMLIYQTFWKQDSRNDTTRFKQIGTLIIRENQPAETEEESIEST